MKQIMGCRDGCCGACPRCIGDEAYEDGSDFDENEDVEKEDEEDEDDEIEQ